MKALLPFLILCCTLFSCDKDDNATVDDGIRSEFFVDCLRPIAQAQLNQPQADDRARITLYSCTSCEDGMVYLTKNGSGEESVGSVRNLDCEEFCIAGGFVGNTLERCIENPEFIEVVWEDPR